MLNPPRLATLTDELDDLDDCLDDLDDHCHACHGEGCVACRNNTEAMERFRKEAIWDRMENEV